MDEFLGLYLLRNKVKICSSLVETCWVTICWEHLWVTAADNDLSRDICVHNTSVILKTLTEIASSCVLLRSPGQCVFQSSRKCKMLWQRRLCWRVREFESLLRNVRFWGIGCLFPLSILFIQSKSGFLVYKWFCSNLFSSKLARWYGLFMSVEYGRSVSFHEHAFLHVCPSGHLVSFLAR